MANTVYLDVAKRLDIVARKNDTFKLTLTLTDANGNDLVAGDYSYKMDIRETDTSADPATLSLSTSAGDIDTSGATVTITSNGVNFSGDYVYDFQATGPSPSTDVHTWFYGIFVSREDITT